MTINYLDMSLDETPQKRLVKLHPFLKSKRFKTTWINLSFGLSSYSEKSSEEVSKPESEAREASFCGVES